MIRKVIIVALMLAAVATVGVRVASERAPVFKKASSRNFSYGFYLGRRKFTLIRAPLGYVQGGEVVFPPGVGIVLPPASVQQVRQNVSRANPPKETIMLPSAWRFAGFSFQFIRVTGGGTIHILTCPLWLPLILFAAYPTIALIRGPLRRQRRRKRGRCVKCGYDLTGNTSGVCPECGTKIEGP